MQSVLLYSPLPHCSFVKIELILHLAFNADETEFTCHLQKK